MCSAIHLYQMHTTEHTTTKKQFIFVRKKKPKHFILRPQNDPKILRETFAITKEAGCPRLIEPSANDPKPSKVVDER